MAFSADELRVLRRALAHALQTTSPSAPLGALGPEWTQDIQEYLRLAEAVDEAVREGGRLRAFLLADLARYRAALPGSAMRLPRAAQGGAGSGPCPRPRRPRRSPRAAPGPRNGRERAPQCPAAPLRAARRAFRTDPAARAARRPLSHPRRAGAGARAGAEAGAQAGARTRATAQGPAAGPPHPHPRRGLPAPPQARPAPREPHRLSAAYSGISRPKGGHTPWITSQRCSLP